MEYDGELIDIVSENNEVIGKATRGEAHRKGLIHRALSVLVISSKGELLLQQRSASRSIHALSWDLSTSEHVQSGEAFESAGERSLKEELGITANVIKASSPKLQKREYHLKSEMVYENEIVLSLTANHEGPFKPDPNEVAQVSFFSVDEIEKIIESGEKFTPWFIDEWENVKSLIVNR